MPVPPEVLEAMAAFEALSDEELRRLNFADRNAVLTLHTEDEDNEE